MSKSTKAVATAAVMALLLAACGGDDGTQVRNLGGSAGSPSGSGSASGIAAECDPVNPDREAQAEQTVAIDALDYAFEPAEVSVGSGIVTFEVSNVGDEPHELAFLPGGGDVPFTAEGEPDEEALEAAGAFELEAFAGGADCTATYDLEPGTYTLFCIVETDEGVTHYELGMRGTLVVEG